MSPILLKPFNTRLFLILALSVVLLATVFGAANTSDQEKNSSYLLREGTTLDTTDGFFQLAGERTVFFMQKDKRRFVCLENLALQRIRAQSPDAQWQVRGMVTEFNGENYLLIEMAVMTETRQKAAP